MTKEILDATNVAGLTVFLSVYRRNYRRPIGGSA